MSSESICHDSLVKEGAESQGKTTMYKRMHDLAAGAIVLVEANPLINDGGRLVATAAVFTATQDPKLTSAAFAGMTLAVEGAGAWGASHILSRARGKRFMEKTHAILEKAHISKFVSGALPDAAIAMTLGTSVMLAAKQAKDPNRSKAENVCYGTAMALGSTTVASAEVLGLSASISEGMRHPSPLVMGLGALSLAALVKGGNMLKSRLRSHERFDDGAQLYRQKFDVRSRGPQVEGLGIEEIIESAHDKRSVFVATREGAHFPVLIPIEHNGEYNKRYFDTHFTDKDVYHFSDVFEKLSPQDLDENAAAKTVGKALKKLSHKNALIVTDYIETTGQEKTHLEDILDAQDIAYDKTHFIDPRNNEPAAVTHFYGDGLMQAVVRERDFEPAQSYGDAFRRLRERKPEKYDGTYGTVLIEPDQITDELFEDIWSLYSHQFDELIKENPSMQEQTKEDLKNTLQSEGSLLVASFEEGKPICVAYFVTDISKVYWLRKDYYDKTFPGRTIWYFPGIAVDAKHEGLARSMSVIGLATEIASECNMEPTITFQCTNVSKDYVPKIAKFAIEHTGHYKIDFDQLAKYSYVGYHLS